MSIYPLLTLKDIYQDHIGHQVRVFISDSNGRWAIEDFETKKRIFNTNMLTLRDISTYVDEEKRKQCVKHVRLTHAYVIGTIDRIIVDRSMKRLDYDPHRWGHFFYHGDCAPFYTASRALCGKKYVWVP